MSMNNFLNLGFPRGPFFFSRIGHPLEVELVAPANGFLRKNLSLNYCRHLENKNYSNRSSRFGSYGVTNEISIRLYMYTEYIVKFKVTKIEERLRFTPFLHIITILFGLYAYETFYTVQYARW